MLSTTLFFLLVAQTEPAPTPAPARPLPTVTDDFRPNEPPSVRLDYDPAFLALFEEHSFTYTGGGYQDRLFRYRLFVPETSPHPRPLSHKGRRELVGRGSPDDVGDGSPDPAPADADRFPLIVWLHGVSTSGDDNVTQLRHLSTLVFPAPWEHNRYPFFVLAVQCPHDNRSWTRS